MADNYVKCGSCDSPWVLNPKGHGLLGQNFRSRNGISLEESKRNSKITKTTILNSIHSKNTIIRQNKHFQVIKI